MIHHAELTPNQFAIEKLLKVEPIFTQIGTAQTLLGIRPFTVLHAGPPFKNPKELPKSIRSSLILTALYEDWAQNVEHAISLIEGGLINMLPAQDHHCVTPLAALISPKTALIGVKDKNSNLHHIYAPLSSGPPPDLRFGALNMGCLETMQLRDKKLMPLISQVIREPIHLKEIALIGLSKGDELHSSTLHATIALRDEFVKALEGINIDANHILFLSTLMQSNPGFFLTFWMAACKLYLSSLEGVDGSTLVSKIGSNGESIGLSIASNPNRWFIEPATSPAGHRFSHASQSIPIQGVVGDSSVIDIMGFGGQLTHQSPDVFESLKDFLPSSLKTRPNIFMCQAHPQFSNVKGILGNFDVMTGLDVDKVHSSQITPLINIGMLADDGVNGLLGRGVYICPAKIFEKALCDLK